MPADSNPYPPQSYDPKKIKVGDIEMGDPDSDEDLEDQLDAEGGSRDGHRTPGDSLLPAKRIESIIQTEGEPI